MHMLKINNFLCTYIYIFDLTSLFEKINTLNWTYSDYIWLFGGKNEKIKSDQKNKKIFLGTPRTHRCRTYRKDEKLNDDLSLAIKILDVVFFTRRLGVENSFG